MPFDSLPTETNIYLQRRQMACMLWNTIELEKFNMGSWRCGSTACALGWLAYANHDGWRWIDNKMPGREDISVGYHAAAVYFGLSFWDAALCFGASPITAAACSWQDIRDVGPSDIGKLLMTMPVTVHA